MVMPSSMSAAISIGADDRGCTNGRASVSVAINTITPRPTARVSVACTASIWSGAGVARPPRPIQLAVASIASQMKKPMISGPTAAATLVVAHPSGWPSRLQWTVQRCGTSPQNSSSKPAAASNTPSEIQRTPLLSRAAAAGLLGLLASLAGGLVVGGEHAVQAVAPARTRGRVLGLDALLVEEVVE